MSPTPSPPRGPSRRQFLGASLAAGGLVAGATAGLAGAARALGATSSAVEAADPADTTSLVLAVDPASVVGQLPARTLGFSFERSTLPTPLFQADNAAVVALFGLLGAGLLRLGGNSVERTGWDPTGPGDVAGTVAPPDLDRLAGFAETVDWPVLLGTPFVTGTAASVANEAAAAVAHLGSNLVGVELCNEPDLYVADPDAAPLAGTYPLFRSRWEAFADAVADAAPDAPLTGPAACLLQTAPGWTIPFASDEGGRLGLLTQHYYRGFGGTETIAELLGDDPAFGTTLPQLSAAATADGIGYRLAETNSFASGGAPGVSNTLASALWGVGLALGAASLGAAGINVHNSGSGPGYPAFVQVGGVVTEVRPLFHGLLLVAAVGTGDLVASTWSTPTDGVRSWAVRRADGSVAVVVVNTTGLDLEVSVALPTGSDLGRATASTLTGPALDATTGVTFRGAAVAADGSWDPDPPTALSRSGSSAAVVVPAASAALVELTLAPPPTTTGTTSSTTSTSTTGTPASTTPSTSVSTTARVPSAVTAATPVVDQPTFTG